MQSKLARWLFTVPLALLGGGLGAHSSSPKSFLQGQAQLQLEKQGTLGNGDCKMTVVKEKIKMTMDPGGKQPDSTSTTVTVNDNGGPVTKGGTGLVTGTEGGDTVDVNGNHPHTVIVVGAGGTVVNVNNPNAHGSVENTGGANITVNLPGRTPPQILVPAGGTRNY